MVRVELGMVTLANPIGFLNFPILVRISRDDIRGISKNVTQSDPYAVSEENAAKVVIVILEQPFPWCFVIIH